MEKIKIKNFLAIKEAEIEIRRVTVLIGEQASGKSTVAKLIYFFKSLKDDLFTQIYKAEKADFDKLEDLIYPIRNKFYDFFGSTLHLKEFSIRYYFSSSKYIDLTLDNRKRLNVNVTDFLRNEVVNALSSIKKVLHSGKNSNIAEQLVFEENKLVHAKRLSTIVNELFENNQNNSLYVIAGRNATVSYSELFEKYLFASAQIKVEEQSKLSEDKKIKNFETTVDENLMLKFIERVVKHKETFKKFGNFDGLIDSYADGPELRRLLQSLKTKIELILRGTYSIDGFGEKIITNKESEEYIYLSNASSGQQESIRILQDIFLNVLNKHKLLRIIEEPESHLFPTAQKHLIELLVLMANQNEENQLIITTHSPYVLTVLNNLLFASRITNKNDALRKDVSKIIDRNYWIIQDQFSAYSLSYSGEGIKYCENLVSEQTQLIKQNYLDTVSESLSNEFNALYQLHTQTFARR